MRHAFPMPGGAASFRWLGLTLTISAGLVACGDDDSSNLASEQISVTSVAWAETPEPPATEGAEESTEEVATLAVTGDTWTPEALENLLAPVALYPDVVLAQVLVASTNPQEVLDAGNWILENTALQDESLDKAAQEAGFTVPMRSLIQFPQVVDMMCQDLDWTSELGQAYVNDQAGVLEAAQRLRVQAQDVGNLQTSDQMKVDTVTQDNQQVVTISPPSTQIIYVPQYDPVAVYAPAPATTTTTTVVQADTYSSSDLVVTGLLAFGAGMLVNEIFSDNNNYYNRGGYWGRPAPYYPPRAYRPRYGNGFYPSNGYNRRNGNFNNNNIIVNQNNNYWNNRKTGNDRSPISEARRDRPELNSLNSQAAKGPKRSAPARSSINSGDRTRSQSSLAGTTASRPEGAGGRGVPKVQGSYAGSRPTANRTQGSVAAVKPGGTGAQRGNAKVQGSYAGAKPSTKNAGSRSTDRGRTSSASRSQAKPRAPSSSGGRVGEKPRQTHSTNKSSGSRKSALSGSHRGDSSRAASNRGRNSMQRSSASRGGHQGRRRR